MEKARFKVAMSPIAPGPLGAERVEFLLSANPGEPLKPLAKVASGGELSRIMLALKSVAAQAGGAPVMIFDEIDVGVGGRTGSALAAKLRALGERSQVLCVTHLPQIAAAAHRHFSIQKREEGGRTMVNVQEVMGGERIAEVARMLGGATATALQHAQELLEAFSDSAEPARV
jgi:DNA repair protein RecN (Recombination protein N)